MPGARRIFAGVRGSPGNLHALRYAADLAREHDATLIPLRTCPVLAIPPSELARDAGAGLRGWAFRHRGLDPARAGLRGSTS